MSASVGGGGERSAPQLDDIAAGLGEPVRPEIDADRDVGGRIVEDTESVQRSRRVQARLHRASDVERGRREQRRAVGSLVVGAAPNLWMEVRNVDNQPGAWPAPSCADQGADVAGGPQVTSVP